MMWNVAQNTDAAFIGTLMHLTPDDSNSILALLEDEDLHDERFREVLKVIRKLSSSGVQPDPITIADEIKRENGTAIPRDLHVLIYELYQYPPVIKNAWPYLEGVLEGALRRRYARLSCFEELAEKGGLDSLPIQLETLTGFINDLHHRLTRVQEIRSSKENTNDGVQPRLIQGG